MTSLATLTCSDPIRRPKDSVPAAVALPVAGGGDGLCVGGERKCTVAVVRDGEAVLSQDLGDLTHPSSFSHFKRTIADQCDRFGVEPRWIAHDLHPAFLSTDYAKQLAAERGVFLVGVQHHHAHAASLMAEHGLTQPVLAVVCDGVGYGSDGAAWGGELMAVNLAGFGRLASLRPMTLAGGDTAARDIRRCGIALLSQALGDGFGCHTAAKRLVAEAGEREVFTAMIKRGVSCVNTSSTGRLFDGVAALLGVCHRNRFEAQAATALMRCADEAGEENSDQEPLYVIRRSARGLQQIDLSPFVRRLLAWQDQGKPVAQIAWAFHDQLAAAWEAVVTAAVQQTGIRCVGLSGGVFCNELFTGLLSQRLTGQGLRVLLHGAVAPHDGGLSLGQAAVAAVSRGGRPTKREALPCA